MLSVTGCWEIAGLLKGQAALYSVVGAIGDVDWEITEGATVSGTPVISGAKNINATVTPVTAGTFKIKATDATTSAFAEKTVEVVEPITVNTSIYWFS